MSGDGRWRRVGAVDWPRKLESCVKSECVLKECRYSDLCIRMGGIIGV